MVTTRSKQRLIGQKVKEEEGDEGSKDNICCTRRSVLLNDSRCLTFSSLFFLLPAAITAYYDCSATTSTSDDVLIYYGILSVVTSIISFNYWRDAIDGVRRSLDLITAKISFVIYFVTGCMYMKDNVYLLTVAIPICILIAVCFSLSSVYWNNGSIYWVYLHMMFHFFVALEQMMVLYSIVLYAHSVG